MQEEFTPAAQSLHRFGMKAFSICNQGAPDENGKDVIPTDREESLPQPTLTSIKAKIPRSLS